MKSLTHADFKPLERHSRVDTITPAPDSYRRQVMRRLYKNITTMIAFLVILLVIAMALVGPLLWTVDPAHQNLAEISLSPVSQRSALLVDNRVQTGTEALADVKKLSVLEANTEVVRLVWKPVKAAQSYRIYRHELPPSGRFDLGLPLAELKAGQVSYEDRMGLKARPYYYSVVTARGGSGNEEIIETVEVKPRPAISVWDARLSGLLDDNKSTEQLVGQEVILPAHPLGTDYLGRDILSRLIYGARTSLFIGIVAPLIFIGFGTIYGAFAGFMGGRVDHWMMRVVDFVIALPFLLFMILFKVMFGLGPGESGVVPMMLALVLLSWPDSARLVRGQVMQLREQAYVDAARLLGGGNGYIIFSHILPNVLGLLLVAFSFAIPSAIFTEAFLSFIGLGVVPPTPSWGSMCNDGIRTMLTHPHELLFPAIFISATVLAFNLLGDGLRDALDERGQTA
jgi:oligopeptide transport system permease protein